MAAMSAGGEFSFSIKPEELEEKGTNILKICDDMREALERIEDAMKGLESWNSTNKIKYEAKIKRALPEMYRLVDVTGSYGGVARQTSSRIISAENFISKQING